MHGTHLIFGRKQETLREEEDEGPALSISAPFNFEHNYHATVDPNSATGFKGLPPGWEELLKQAKITKEEAMKDGDAIIDILRFHAEMGNEPKLPTAVQASREARMAVQFANQVKPCPQTSNPAQVPGLEAGIAVQRVIAA